VFGDSLLFGSRKIQSSDILYCLAECPFLGPAGHQTTQTNYAKRKKKSPPLDGIIKSSPQHHCISWLLVSSWCPALEQLHIEREVAAFNL
jgi:hypothetical protein